MARALDAGRISRDAAIEVRQLVDSVEQTDDQDEHRRLLEAALATSIHTVTLTVAALPFVGPDRWVEAWLGTEATTALAQAHKLRESADSEDFLELVGKAVEDLGLSTLAGRRIVTRLVGVSLP